ncbi:toxin [Salmonella bongori]|nr:toxin [Salmonella bongori]
MLRLLSERPMTISISFQHGISPGFWPEISTVRLADLKMILSPKGLIVKSTVLAPEEPTQVGGGVLDYGVIVDRAPYSQRLQALRNDTTPQLASDHYPVAFLAQSC